MRLTAKLTMLMAVLAVSACTNANRFDNDAVDLNAATGSAGGILPGSASDPRSPAYFQQTVGDRVLFTVDQSTLSPEARATLDGQVQWLLTNSDYNAVIEGHADEQGTRAYNLALGARRANSVMEYLVAQGIPTNRLRFVSYGKERPLCFEHTTDCWQLNRSVRLVVE